jgi:hypothetical protein
MWVIHPVKSKDDSTGSTNGVVQSETILVDSVVRY